MSELAFEDHLATGLTTVCRCWAVTRRDGTVMGFTDHDLDLSFDDITFRANTGLTARAVEQTTGLAVDNSEAMGALSDPSIREEDVRAGLYDGAEVASWQVNWARTDERRMLFRGSLGEIERGAGAFRAELRGLAEALNQPQGLVFQRPCSAVLGDARCGVDLASFQIEASVTAIRDGLVLTVELDAAAQDGWFSKGRFEVIEGAGVGRSGLIRRDRRGALRQLDLWETEAGVAVGDRLRLTAGCDKRIETCREKFSNAMAFRGFPDIPGEDWLMSYPVRSARNDGGSLR